MYAHMRMVLLVGVAVGRMFRGRGGGGGLLSSIPEPCGDPHSETEPHYGRFADSGPSVPGSSTDSARTFDNAWALIDKTERRAVACRSMTTHLLHRNNFKIVSRT